MWPKFEKRWRPAPPSPQRAVGLVSRPGEEFSGGLTWPQRRATVVFPGPDEIEGFWALDKMHATASHAALVRPDRAHAVRGLHQGPGRVRLPDDGLVARINHYFYMAFHPIPDEAELADRDPLPRQARHHGPRRRQDVGGGVSPRSAPQRGAAYGRLLGPERRGADRQARRVHAGWSTSGGSTDTSTSSCSSSAFCDLYDEVMQPEGQPSRTRPCRASTRSVGAQRGLWDLSRTAKASLR